MTAYLCGDCGGAIDRESLEMFKGGIQGRCSLCRYFGPVVEQSESTQSTSDIIEEKSGRKADYLRDREMDKGL